jgi:hypothetical protein
LIGLVLALQSPMPAQSPPWYGTAGRIITTPTLHVGIRPAFFLDPDEISIGLTVQITAKELTL